MLSSSLEQESQSFMLSFLHPLHVHVRCVRTHAWRRQAFPTGTHQYGRSATVIDSSSLSAQPSKAKPPIRWHAPAGQFSAAGAYRIKLHGLAPVRLLTPTIIDILQECFNWWVWFRSLSQCHVCDQRAMCAKFVLCVCASNLCYVCAKIVLCVSNVCRVCANFVLCV